MLKLTSQIYTNPYTIHTFTTFTDSPPAPTAYHDPFSKNNAIHNPYCRYRYRLSASPRFCQRHTYIHMHDVHSMHVIVRRSTYIKRCWLLLLERFLIIVTAFCDLLWPISLTFSILLLTVFTYYPCPANGIPWYILTQ